MARIAPALAPVGRRGDCFRLARRKDALLSAILLAVACGVAGVRQSQVHVRLGLDFPELLRSVLRQAPDVIMIGEIRDPVTAQTAVRAANSGHLVLATMHAPVSDRAVQSMHSFGVHPHFLSTCLRGVIAQRLVRTRCAECKTPVDLSFHGTLFDEVHAWLKPGDGQVLFAAKGCPACHHTGYVSRSGVFEMLPVGPTIRSLIFDQQPAQIPRRQALDGGMLDFRQAALLKITQGQTTIEEIVRAIPTEYLGSLPHPRAVNRKPVIERSLPVDLDASELHHGIVPAAAETPRLEPSIPGNHRESPHGCRTASG